MEDLGAESFAYLYNAATGRSSGERFFAKAPSDVQKRAVESSLYRDMQAIARRFEITGVEESDETLTLRARDLGIRNFGGRFASTKLVFDRSGKLVHEVADI